MDTVTGSTLAGTFTSSEQVCLEDLTLPEFQPKHKLPKLSANVFHTKCHYGLIVGRDVLGAFGVVLDFKDNCILSSDISLPMRNFPSTQNGVNAVHVLLDECLDCMTLNDEDPSSDNVYATGSMMDSKYEGADPQAIANTCKHLSEDQRADLAKLFAKFHTLFDGKLCVFTDEKICLKLDQTVSPHCS